MNEEDTNQNNSQINNNQLSQPHTDQVNDQSMQVQNPTNTKVDSGMGSTTQQDSSQGVTPAAANVNNSSSSLLSNVPQAQLYSTDEPTSEPIEQSSMTNQEKQNVEANLSNAFQTDESNVKNQTNLTEVNNPNTNIQNNNPTEDLPISDPLGLATEKSSQEKPKTTIDDQIKQKKKGLFNKKKSEVHVEEINSKNIPVSASTGVNKLLVGMLGFTILLLALAGGVIGFLVADNYDLFGGSNSTNAGSDGPGSEVVADDSDLKYTQEEAVEFNDTIIEVQNKIKEYIDQFYTDVNEKEGSTVKTDLTQNASRVDGLIKQMQEDINIKDDGVEFYNSSLTLFEFYRDIMATQLPSLVDVLENPDLSDSEKEREFNDINNNVASTEEDLFNAFATAQDKFAEKFGIELVSDADTEEAVDDDPSVQGIQDTIEVIED